MKRKAFLLGFYSIGGQVLLLRELVSSLNGDELFIGTALFGWLLSVAVGAQLGGRARARLTSAPLFLLGAILLPMMIVVIRLLPLAVADVVGELIPFSEAALVSIFTMFPVGLVSGWLFSAITGEGERPAGSIVNVYLLEGIGAFVGGLILAFTVGGPYSTLCTSFGIGVIVIATLFFDRSRGPLPGVAIWTAALTLLVIMPFAVGKLDPLLDRVKYASWQVIDSFDTHYGRQTLLARDDATVLLTDNTIEAVHPEPEAAETLILPPLMLRPEARRLLLFGRAEPGPAQLVRRLPGVQLTAVDPRSRLTDQLAAILSGADGLIRINDDPVAFADGGPEQQPYDILILSPGDLGSYKASRLLTPQFLSRAKSLLKPDGVLYLVTAYDSDRYITAEAAELLAILSNAIKETFTYATLWPGNNTLLFASDTPLGHAEPDTLCARLSRFGYESRYYSVDRLADRLDPFKLERLAQALGQSNEINSVTRPLLSYYQTIYRSKASGIDRSVFTWLRQHQWSILLLPVLILLLFSFTVRSKRGSQSYGLFLYFVAGAVSLSLELVSFYVYQSSAGSLYAEMAILIGAFMLGLASGTYTAIRWTGESKGGSALLMLLAATLTFLFTWDTVHPQAQLLYHAAFLLVVALATGSLFVAATHIYYGDGRSGNRGTGYAVEIAGSSVGALFATTLLLPFIGLGWLLLSLALLIVLSLGGLIVCQRG